MNKSGEEILADIDHTLDQLIRNAHMLRQISDQEAFASYSARMHKTQASLAARVIHMEDLLEETNLSPDGRDPVYEAIQRKISEYKKLNNRMLDTLSARFKKAQRANKPRIGRNRKNPFA